MGVAKIKLLLYESKYNGQWLSEEQAASKFIGFQWSH